MGLKNLYNTILSYTQQQESFFMMNGGNILLQAINNAFTFAGRQKDWWLQMDQAQVSVDPNLGGDLTMATLLDGTTPVKISTFSSFYYPFKPDGVNVTLLPLELNTKKCVGNWIKERRRQRNYFNPFWRYPSDAVPYGFTRQMSCYVHGTRIYYDPSFQAATNIQFDVVKKFDLFTQADVTNDTEHWFIDQAFAWLMYSALIELNNVTNQFVVRAEGFIGPPTQLLQREWDSLTAWDDNQYESAMGGNHEH